MSKSKENSLLDSSSSKVSGVASNLLLLRTSAGLESHVKTNRHKPLQPAAVKISTTAAPLPDHKRLPENNYDIDGYPEYPGILSNHMNQMVHSKQDTQDLLLALKNSRREGDRAKKEIEALQIAFKLQSENNQLAITKMRDRIKRLPHDGEEKTNTAQKVKAMESTISSQRDEINGGLAQITKLHDKNQQLQRGNDDLQEANKRNVNELEEIKCRLKSC